MTAKTANHILKSHGIKEIKQLEGKPGNIIWSVIYYTLFFRRFEWRWIELAEKNNYKPETVKMPRELPRTKDGKKIFSNRLAWVRYQILNRLDIEFEKNEVIGILE